MLPLLVFSIQILVVAFVFPYSSAVRPVRLTDTIEDEHTEPGNKAISHAATAHMGAHDRMVTPTACHQFTRPAEKTVQSIQRVMLPTSSAGSSLLENERRLKGMPLGSASSPAVDSEFEGVINVAIADLPECIDIDAQICICDTDDPGGTEIMLHLAGIAYKIANFSEVDKNLKDVDGAIKEQAAGQDEDIINLLSEVDKNLKDVDGAIKEQAAGQDENIISLSESSLVEKASEAQLKIRRPDLSAMAETGKSGPSVTPNLKMVTEATEPKATPSFAAGTVQGVGSALAETVTSGPGGTPNMQEGTEVPLPKATPSGSASAETGKSGTDEYPKLEAETATPSSPASGKPGASSTSDPDSRRALLDQLSKAAYLEVILADLPTTSFSISVEERVFDAQNKLKHLSVQLTGNKVPAWISTYDALQVFIGDCSYGCINEFDRGGGPVAVDRGEKEPVEPLVQKVRLRDGSDSAAVFDIVTQPEDESEELQEAVMKLLKNPASISLCPATVAKPE